MDHFVIFSIQEWGFNRDEVGAHIAKLHDELKKADAKYRTLAEKHKRLKERYKALSEKTKAQE